MQILMFFERNRDAIATIRWFFSDFFPRYKYELIFITLLGAGATAIQASILVALNRIVAGGTSADLFQWIGSSHASLILGGGVVALLSISAYLTYLNSERTLALWPRYQCHTLSSLFVALQSAASREVVDLVSVQNSAFSKTLRGTQRLGAFSRIVTKSILSTLSFIGFSIYAILAEPIVTLIVFLIVIPLSAFMLLYFSRRTARCDRAAESIAHGAAKELNIKIKACMSQDTSEYALNSSEEFDVKVIDRMTFLVDRFVWVERARLATALITFVMLGGLVALLGEGGDVNWGELLIYFIALMLAFLQLSNLVSAISTFGRFYPTVLRHRNMLLALQLSNSPDEFRTRLRQAGLVERGRGRDDDEYLD